MPGQAAPSCIIRVERREWIAIISSDALMQLKQNLQR